MCISSSGSDNEYKTKVFDVARVSKSGSVVQIMDQLDCTSLTNSGLFSLFLVPPRDQFNSQTFKDAAEADKGYYPLHINSDGNFENAINKFDSQSESLKEVYGNEYPKLCGTRTNMIKEAAQSRVDTLIHLFNFPYSSDKSRNIQINENLSCKLKNV